MATLDPITGEVKYATPSIVQAPTAATVYSEPNITQAVTAPVTAPNLSDPYGLYDSFMNSAEIKAAKAKVAEGQGLINQSNQALRTTTTALENQNENAMGGTGASVNLIGRQVGRARTLTANELAALGENQNANIAYLSSIKEDAANKYSIAQNERAQLQELIRSTGGKAGISYTDSFESALQKATGYAEDQKKDAEKSAFKDALRSLGLKTSGSYKELEKRLRKANKAAVSDAKRNADLQYQTALAQFNKLKQTNSNGSGTLDVASLFGD